jgi:tellurite resistance-related uncharacterized protein
VKRPIVGFHQDEEEHWVADLSCGHGQHTRHDPPFVERPWVLTAEGRAARLGSELDCVRCDRRELPAGHAPHRRTTVFDAASLPAALRARHATRAGVWALIHVTRGRVEAVLDAPFHAREVLSPGTPGVVPAEVPHHVTPLGDGAFFLELWRRADPAPL